LQGVKLSQGHDMRVLSSSSAGLLHSALKESISASEFYTLEADPHRMAKDRNQEQQRFHIENVHSMMTWHHL